MIVAGVAYAVVGAGSAALDDTVWANGWRPWRLAAWVASAIVGAMHFAYEHYRRVSRPSRTALHVSGAVALGAFGIALAANVHWWLAATRPARPPLLALPLFPAVTAIPAFLAAFAAATVMTRLSRRGRVLRTF
jgi:hypothetical protein